MPYLHNVKIFMLRMRNVRTFFMRMRMLGNWCWPCGAQCQEIYALHANVRKFMLPVSGKLWGNFRACTHNVKKATWYNLVIDEHVHRHS
jgi:hypothetical protein